MQLTKLKIRNFKKLEDADIDLGGTVVFIGPNNSGKTTALQALALWEIGLKRWNEKRGGRTSPEKRPGVTINRRDLIAIPVPRSNLLWRDVHVRDSEVVPGKEKPQTKNVLIEIIVEGVSQGKAWECGFEFDYANEESFYCRPLRIPNGETGRMPVPPEAAAIKLAFLPPMSGLAAVEPKWETGRVNVLIGEGQTAQVLRNLCFQLYDRNDKSKWQELVNVIKKLFGAELEEPRHVVERGEIVMAYKEPNGLILDLSSSGRGMQQTLLLLAHLYANPQTVLLLDEPDAHLEILRQRQIFSLLNEVSLQQGSQIIIASHSEVLLNEAADRGTVVAFVGKPHRLKQGGQVNKSLAHIGWEHYYEAETTGWVLYLEGPTDLAIIKEFAALLDHPVSKHLETVFVHYVANNLPQLARDHFYGLREAKTDLIGIAIFDQLEKNLDTDKPLLELMWRKREIENYFCREDVLIAFARHDQPDDLFGRYEMERRESAMREAIGHISEAFQTLSKPNPWSPEIKASDEFLAPLFSRFFKSLNVPMSLRKAEYYRLVKFLSPETVDTEVVEKLDAIYATAQRAVSRER